MIKLESPRFTQEEVEKTVSWLNDPILMKYSEQRHKHHDLKSQLKFIYDFAPPHHYRKITAENQYIGTITAYVDRVNGVADVGILVGSSYSGRGYGEQAWRLFLQELRREGVRKIEAGCMARNKPMIRIFEKNHMRLEGTRRAHFQIGENQYDDLVMYGIFP